MTRVLFVCLGNICRSPAAEGILRKKSEAAKAKIVVDSAGTGGWHAGENPDDRMIEHAAKRGYDLSELVARQFDPKKDFTAFDWIVTMDESNLRNVQALDREGQFQNKIKRMVSFCRIHNVKEVPDPYYKGDDGFEQVLDILEDGCDEMIEQITSGKIK
jgi:protein-tyrosine phosphatase